MTREAYIHPKAEVHHTARIYPGTWIGPNVKIEEDVHIGPNCVIGFPGGIRGLDPEDDFAGRVIIRQGARLCAGVVVSQGQFDTEPPTLIGARCLVMNGANIGHNAAVFPGAEIGAGALLCGWVQIGEGAMVKTGAVVRSFVTVGHGAVVGMGAVVTKDVAPGVVTYGAPARVVRPDGTAVPDVGSPADPTSGSPDVAAAKDKDPADLNELPGFGR